MDIQNVSASQAAQHIATPVQPIQPPGGIEDSSKGQPQGEQNQSTTSNSAIDTYA